MNKKITSVVKSLVLLTLLITNQFGLAQNSKKSFREQREEEREKSEEILERAKFELNRVKDLRMCQKVLIGKL
jgi:hypothetical protein